MGHILVIAPNADLRRSLRFALEAEGHSILSCSSVAEALAAPGPYDCTVIDHHASDGTLASFPKLFGPVVLLANSATHPLARHSAATLTKPALGPFLSQAVGQAMAPRGNPT